ncbi:MAG: Ldh family oxidoreductase [Gammaproteobacteria bacterium]|nr:Ldh family oxidoreductase [Gammaproteobacteria bacterium]MDH3429689.1 Ldh family oxidoreductase [Gammaproteobacteria bacterium]
MSDHPINVAASTLMRFLAEIFEKAGCPESDAAVIADCMVQTNLWGIDSHGVIRTAKYLDRIRSGGMNATPKIRTLQAGAGLEVLDADNGSGYVAGKAAMARAIEIAARQNIAAVGVINSNHCGATSLYAHMALEHDMIGIAMSNVAPNMVMTGGSRAITGNNPIAVAVPSFGDFPFVLDISMSAVAGGKLLVAARNGEKIPLGWATDNEGRPTTDPRAGFDGFLLPLGGHKGFGLSLLVDILCGVITGGSFQHQLKSMYRYPNEPSNTAHLMIVINPLVLIDKEQLKERMSDFVKTIKTSPMCDPDAEMLLPGELEHRREQQRRDEGIPLPAALFAELEAIGKELNLDSALAAISH